MLTRSRRHEWTCQYDISCWQTLIWVVKVELCVSGSPNPSTGKLLRYIRSGVAKTGKEMGRCYCHRGQWQLDSSQAKFSTAASFSASRMRYKRQYKPGTGSAVVSTEHGTRVSRVSVSWNVQLYRRYSWRFKQCSVISEISNRKFLLQIHSQNNQTYRTL